MATPRKGRKTASSSTPTKMSRSTRTPGGKSVATSTPHASGVANARKSTKLPSSTRSRSNSKRGY